MTHPDIPTRPPFNGKYTTELDVLMTWDESCRRNKVWWAGKDPHRLLLLIHDLRGFICGSVVTYTLLSLLS